MISFIKKTASQNAGALVALIAIQVAMAILMCLPPFYLQELVSAVIDYRNSEFPLGAIIILIGLLLASSLLSGSNGYLAAWFSSGLLRSIQTKFFGHLQSLPIDYLRRQSLGEFFTRFNNDVGQFQQLIASVLPQIIKELTICALVITFLLFSFPGYLVLSLLGICGLYLLLGSLLQRILSKFAIKQRASWGEINRQFDEVASGAETIRAFNAEETTLTDFNRETTKFRQLALDASKLTSILSPLIDLASRLGGLLVTIFAIYLVFIEVVSVDQFVLFFFLAALLQGSISALVNHMLGLPPFIEGTRRLTEFFETGTDEQDCGTRVIDLSQGVKIQFKNVHFSYAGAQELYNGLSFCMDSNRLTHLTGQNGSGKTTLVNLLLGFYKPTKGQIKINDIDMRELDKQELRKHISVVSQQQHIFNDSVKANLMLANPEATDIDCLLALSQVGLGEWVKGLDLGLETKLDPSGKNMSGGEKQKLGIARVLLRKSPLLIFDEPWSNLDVVSKKNFSELLPEVSSQSTVLLISHNISVNRNTQNIKLDRLQSEIIESPYNSYSNNQISSENCSTTRTSDETCHLFDRNQIHELQEK